MVKKYFELKIYMIAQDSYKNVNINLLKQLGQKFGTLVH